ncbi:MULTISPECIES: hypothetical protein [unclassified Streptomyces]|uniref:SbtR family transcriptional regulator n=1 Tax=unclassified Streptomyces TaxID=2593676 RepID=UPI0036619E34
MVTAAPADTLPRTTELRHALTTTGTELLNRAREAAVVRPDLSAADLVPLMCGIAHAVNVHSGNVADRTDTAHRYLATLLSGLRAAPSNT